MNLINFHTFPQNKPHVNELLVHYWGQGLYNSYYIMLVGNGHNKYTMTTDTYQKIYFEEQHITEWTIRHQPCEEQHITEWTIRHQPCEEQDREESEYLQFKGVGRLENGKYEWFDNNDCDEFDIINGYKIVDIQVENEYPHLPKIFFTSDVSIWEGIFDYKYKAIEKLLNYNSTLNVDISGMTKINYNSLVSQKNIDTNKLYYLIVDTFESITVVPFKISSIEPNNKRGNDVWNILIDYEKEMVPVTLEMFYNPELRDDVPDDLYDIVLYTDNDCNTDKNEQISKFLKNLDFAYIALN